MSNFNQGGGYRSYSGNRGYQRNEGYRSGGYRSRNYQGGNGYYGQQQPRKRSGAKAGQYVNKEGEQRPYVRGWKATRQGMMSVICVPTNKPETASANSEKWVARVRIGNQRPETMTAFYHPNSRKVTIPDLDMVLNPNAPNGGYFGPFFQRKNRR